MKLVKMSLAAAVLLGASAFAIDNVKVSGDAKLFYGTSNAEQTAAGTSDALFGYDNSFADVAVRVGATGDLTKGVSFGVTGYAVTTLGLENNMVAHTWTGGRDGVQDNSWMGEAWLAATLGKTTAKIGRMELDTPLAFSEKWSVVPNTFEAAVLLNQDIPDTTLVGAWVGKGNGVNALTPINNLGSVGAVANTNTVGADGIMGADAKMSTFAKQGAYAAAIVNNSYKPLTAQAWYYNVANVADAYWLQADINCQLVKGVTIGAQYANIDPKGVVNSVVANAKDSSAYAAKLGYNGVKNLKVSVAYSDVDKDGVLNIANTATNNMVTAQSKLYTEAFRNYGYVGAPGATSWNATAEYDAGIAKIGAYYTNVSVDNAGNAVISTLDGLGASRTNGTNLNEVAVTVSKSFGPLDTTLAYFSTNANDQNAGKQYDSVQAYLTLNF